MGHFSSGNAWADWRHDPNTDDNGLGAEQELFVDIVVVLTPYENRYAWQDWGHDLNTAIHNLHEGRRNILSHSPVTINNLNGKKKVYVHTVGALKSKHWGKFH